MNELLKFGKVVAGGLFCLLVAVMLTGCSKTDNDELPDGKQPMTFTATVDGLTVTRATAGKDTWAQNDEIAVSTNADGSNHQVYQIANATTGAMSPKAEDNTLYWQQNTGQPITAWYPAATVTNADISSQSAGWADFDYLVSKGSYNFSSTGVQLSFTHAMAKVKITLQQGEGITTDEFNTAVVRVYGYTQALFDKGVASASFDQLNGEITPLVGQPQSPISYEAIVIPQQMQNQKFIKVTIGGNDYFYTPTNNNDANLVAGNQYTYTITVKKTGLTVTVKDNGVTWDENTTSSDATDADFRITAPSNCTVSSATGSVTQVDSYWQLSGSNKFQITIPEQNNKILKGVSVTGFYTILSWTKGQNGDYVITYKIRSDVTLTSGFAERTAMAVGDYYYSDGEWSSDLLPKPCIGIVFKVGKDASDQGNYKNMNDGDLSINGYVVALQDASSGVLAWANKDGAVSTSTSDTDWQGYFNCQQIKNYVSKNGFELGHFPAANACLSFGTAYPQYAAPASSSGWFLPSAGQLKDLYNSSGLLSDRISTLKNTGKYNDISWFSGNWYWSSSEGYNPPAHNAWDVFFGNGDVRYSSKSDGYSVRGVFAF